MSHTTPDPYLNPFHTLKPDIQLVMSTSHALRHCQPQHVQSCLEVIVQGRNKLEQ